MKCKTCGGEIEVGQAYIVCEEVGYKHLIADQCVRGLTARLAEATAENARIRTQRDDAEKERHDALEKLAEAEARCAEVTANYETYVNDLRTVEEVEIQRLRGVFARMHKALAGKVYDPDMMNTLAKEAKREAAKGGRDDNVR